MQELDPIPCPILVTDGCGRVRSMNREMAALTGVSPEEWIDRSLDELLPRASRIFLLTYIWPMLHDQGTIRELFMHIVGKDGVRTPVLVNCKRAVSDGDTVYHWVFFVALERSRFEAELLKARSDAQKMATHLAKANAELAAMHSELARRAEQIESANRELAELSQSDPLTGLGNRRAMAASIKRWQTMAKPTASASLLLVDVDFFKSVNDRFGHDAGDKVLVSVAKRLQKGIREGDLAIRYGGEEFALWLPDTTLAQAEAIAGTVHEHVRQVRIADRSITVSIGAASLCNAHDPQLMKQLIEYSDKAVYAAKSNGRNCTVLYSELLDESAS